MIRARKILLVAFLALYAVSETPAQQRYELVERRNFWNGGRNAAGLRADTVTVSYAELIGRYTSGGFRNTYDARNVWNAGAVAKTITHTPTYSMTGSFSFDHARGSDMSGSMFIDPGYYPFDVLEFTPGRKDIQKYAFMGGVSMDVATHWRAGAKIDFTAYNYSKRKDLRHYNYRLDMTIAPGVMYHRNGWAVGASYIFNKNSEKVKAEEIGTAATSYDAFLDKGLMYGTLETWQGNGIHLSESGIDGFPVTEIMHGAALQFQWRRLYFEAEYLYSSGKAGEKRSIWFEFPGHHIAGRFGYKFPESLINRFLRLNIDWKQQKNNENVIDVETSDGINLTHTYGSNRIFERTTFSAGAEYEAVGPRGEFRLGAALSSIESLSSLMNPYAFSQWMFCTNIYASGQVRFGRWDVIAGVAFAQGKFTDSFRNLDPNMDAGDPPDHLTQYYNIHNEYMTSPRLTVEAGVRYNFPIGLYAQADAVCTHGFDLRYAGGANRWSQSFRLGYAF